MKDKKYWKEYREKRKAATEVAKKVAQKVMVAVARGCKSATEIATMTRKEMEQEEWKKGKCIFCFVPGKAYFRRYGEVWLCEVHGGEGLPRA